ncbi:MAG TPA: hypothetical protein VL988_10040 [Solirubrobacteraceae bacterium]|nr:hypothetical protein [Solirubrobacteraceae bacterium]
MKRTLSHTGRLTAAGGLLCLVAGAAVLAFVSGFGAVVAGAFLLGLAGIVFVSLFFLTVGEGEERDYRGGGTRRGAR